MPLAIVGTVDNVLGRVVLVGTGMSVVSTTKTYFQRVYSDGRVVNVRNAEPTPSGIATYTVTDWEIPPDTTVRYRITEVTLAGVTTSVDAVAVSTWTIAFPYNGRLVHPTAPALSIKIIITEVSELERAVRTEVHYPIGRPDPIVVAQVRQYATGTVQLLTLTVADRVALVTLLTQAAVFCLQSPEAHALGGGEMWIAALDLTEGRPDSPQASTLQRLFGLDFAAVARPPGLATDLLGRWSDVPPAYATWNAVVADKATWNDFVVGVEIVGSA